MSEKVIVIGGGLAGCEACWQLSERKIETQLWEMKPIKKSAAHQTNELAEIVCSNSFKSNDITNACGLLKQELRIFNSLLIKEADNNSVEAGAALAVDRERFSQAVENRIKSSKYITIKNVVANTIPEGNVIIATGPLTDESLIESIANLTGGKFLHFFDAASPIVTKDSIDFDSAFYASRYDKGSADYINCPMTRREYEIFYEALISAERAEVKDFEDASVFEGCMPVEVMASRGVDTLRFGPLKPVGLTDKRNGIRNYAVLQLRKENLAQDSYNLVGFQTHLTFKEQKRVFGLIPALKNAEYVRYGVMHKNTYINSPGILTENYRLKNATGNIYFAGQLTGVEGYVESISSGMVAALDMYRHLVGKESLSFSAKTMTGAIGNYIANASTKDFQPMNSNFAIIEPLCKEIKDKQLKKQEYANRAIAEMNRLLIEYT